jgi:hypothetical protein
MADFGDSEPEDAWHPDDPVDVLLDNVRRRVVLLVLAGRDGDWNLREEIRARDIEADFQFLIERIRNG